MISIFDDMSQSTFTITTNAEMAEFAGLVNEGTTFAGKTIKLGADVNLTTVIGDTNSEKYFSGNFNGQGHTVTISQTLSNPDGAGGLFSMVRVPANSMNRRHDRLRDMPLICGPILSIPGVVLLVVSSCI